MSEILLEQKKSILVGSKIWEITRVGVDFKLKCKGCEHVVIMPREQALKAIVKKLN